MEGPEQNQNKMNFGNPNLDAQITHDFKLNLQAIWNRSDSNHCGFSNDFLSCFSLMFLVPCCFIAIISLVLGGGFYLFSKVLGVRLVRKIFGVFEVFRGIFEKTKAKKDRVSTLFSTDLEVTLVAISLSLCNFQTFSCITKSMRFWSVWSGHLRTQTAFQNRLPREWMIHILTMGQKRENWRRTNVQQLTCNIDLFCSSYYLFFSFVLLELNPFVLKRKVLGEKLWKVWKLVKKCGKFWNDFALELLPFSFSLRKGRTPANIYRNGHTQNGTDETMPARWQAGWGGPWAAPHFRGVVPGDASTEPSKETPPDGTGPGNARTNRAPKLRAEKTMTATDVTGFDAIFSTGFFATSPDFRGLVLLNCT